MNSVMVWTVQDIFGLVFLGVWLAVMAVAALVLGAQHLFDKARRALGKGKRK